MSSEHRFVITDRLWQRIAPLLPGKATDRGVTAGDNRLFLEAVLWKVRTGAPWPDLPPCFGKWNSQFRRFRPWASSGVFQRLFKALRGDPDLEYALAHRRHHCPGSPESRWGKRGTQRQSIGRSRGGLTTKIVALVDALGNLVRFLLLPGQSHQSKGVAPLISNLPFAALLADKAFDSDGLLREAPRRSFHPRLTAKSGEPTTSKPTSSAI